MKQDRGYSTRPDCQRLPAQGSYVGGARGSCHSGGAPQAVRWPRAMGDPAPCKIAPIAVARGRMAPGSVVKHGTA
jgi:hypothetical protein